MNWSRRFALLSPLLAALAKGQFPDPDAEPEGQPRHRYPPSDDDPKLPNGKSQRDAMARQQHEDALKDADELIAISTEIKAELEKAGNYVVPVSVVRKTEEAEKTARRIRSRLKG